MHGKGGQRQNTKIGTEWKPKPVGRKNKARSRKRYKQCGRRHENDKNKKLEIL